MNICIAHGCKKEIGSLHYMCTLHWKMLSSELQNKIFKYLKKGFVKGRESKGYIKVVKESIKFICKKEGRG